MRIIPLDYDYGDVCAFFQVHGVVPGFVLPAFRGRTWARYDLPGHCIEIFLLGFSRLAVYFDFEAIK
jgi:hypothetical protein